MIYKNVHFLKADPKARWQGYLFYFNEGFCWSDISDTRIRARIKNNGIYDVKSMSLFSRVSDIPDFYFICLLNSSFVGKYIKEFLNNTVSFQINDARKIPVIIPTKDQLFELKKIFDKSVEIQKQKFDNTISNTVADTMLQEQTEVLDKLVLRLYFGV